MTRRPLPSWYFSKGTLKAPSAARSGNAIAKAPAKANSFRIRITPPVLRASNLPALKASRLQGSPAAGRQCSGELLSRVRVEYIFARQAAPARSQNSVAHVEQVFGMMRVGRNNEFCPFRLRYADVMGAQIEPL